MKLFIAYILFLIFLLTVLLCAERPSQDHKGLEQVDLSEYEDLQQIDIQELIEAGE